MGENYELVHKGFQILLNALSGYLGQTLRKVYRDGWWAEVRSALSDQ